MSEGFSDSNIKTFENPTHEIEYRTFKRMSGNELVGTSIAPWGRVEIYKLDDWVYKILMVRTKHPQGYMSGHNEFSNFQDALKSAQRIARSDGTSTRMTKHLDVFTDDFSPPSDATRDSIPGVDYKKDANPYQDAHDDYVPRADKSFTLAAAGKASDQEELDQIDRGEQRMEGGIKKYEDQFPGSSLGEDKSADESSEVKKRRWAAEIKDNRKAFPAQSLAKKIRGRIGIDQEVETRLKKGR